jgi:sulfide dehydrogenase subunit beta
MTAREREPPQQAGDGGLILLPSEIALMPFRILKREQFSPVTYLWELEAPEIARAAEPGHFVIIRHGQSGERIPLTIADFDRGAGTVTLVIQAVGKTTFMLMEQLKEGDRLDDLVGPLGHARTFEARKKVVCVAGGLGVAPVYPQLRKYKEIGAHTLSIIGFRSKDLMFWVEKFRAQSSELFITTDDGTFGMKGFVTTALKDVLAQNPDVEEVLAIGPAVMMKACVDMTRPLGIPTVVSLNPVMVDGTGMCGGCRVTVDDKMKFACVDGPEFDGLKVNFDELLLRARRFEGEERLSLKQYREQHRCALGEV